MKRELSAQQEVVLSFLLTPTEMANLKGERLRIHPNDKYFVPVQIIMGCIHWASSSQGSSYWSRIHCELSRTELYGVFGKYP